ncbi:MAG TPA: hypothetical protein VLV55_06480 [Rhizomicrobium sp.]|nr:hypothetical protein [Rhizomicrobium sp.]
MLVGHYGPAFAARAVFRRIPLWVLFVAVQWMDVVWSILVLLGIEKVRIVPGFTEGSPLDLYYMPYTHSLPGSLVLAGILGAIVSAFYRTRRLVVFAVVAAAVFSHWLLDLIVHVPDLMLYDHVKVGFGLWRHVAFSLPLELVLLAAGAWLYAKCVPARPGGNAWLGIFVAAMVALQVWVNFGPPPASPAAAAQTALLAYGLLALLAGLVDLSRIKA